MTNREKMIEVLLRGCKETADKAGVPCCSEEYCKENREECFGDLINLLLANGVVVREKGEWQYTDDIDEDGNIQAYCSACGAGDKHSTSMVGKVPYCWKCGADMRKGENDG